MPFAMSGNAGTFGAVGQLRAVRKEIVDEQGTRQGRGRQGQGLGEGSCRQAARRREMQAEGKIDKAKGAVHNAVGDVKDAVKKATD